jgi:hypothetical protein
MASRLLTGILVLAALVCAQYRVDPRNTYVLVIAVVPLIGAGTPTDPIRPQYAPAPGAGQAQSGILAFSRLPSDDGKSALVEFVARDRAALLPILSDKQLKAFEKGKDKKDDVEKELKKYRKDFDLSLLGTVLP